MFFVRMPVHSMHHRSYDVGVLALGFLGRAVIP